MSLRRPWRPDWAVIPGDVLREKLGEMGLTSKAAAERMGVAQSYLSDVMTGKRTVTARVALRLEGLTSISAETWLGMQSTYDLALARRAPSEKEDPS